ncbi:MAG: hypothetical protein ACYCW6_12930 [Candidatus Xenobia bacterium]
MLSSTQAALAKLGRTAGDRFVAMVRQSAAEDWPVLSRMVAGLDLAAITEALQGLASQEGNAAEAAQAILAGCGVIAKGPAQRAMELLGGGVVTEVLEVEVAQAVLRLLRKQPREAAEPWLEALQKHADVTVANAATAQLERWRPVLVVAGPVPPGDIAETPFYRCFISCDLFAAGIGHVCVSRRLESGRIGVSDFLVDVFCLGVKNAFYQECSRDQLAQLEQRIQGGVRIVKPEVAARLVEEAVQWAANHGIDPHPDYRAAVRNLAGIDTSRCSETFKFGQNGRPLFMPGPYETPRQIKHILNTLTQRLGRDGFEYIAAWR